MKRKNPLYCLLLFVCVLTFSCKKGFDLPPINTPGNGARINIAAIKTRYSSNAIYKFRGDTSLYCVVIADEVSGNLFKDIYVSDITGGLHIKLQASGGLFIGDSLRINLNGVSLNSYSELIQLDSVDTEKSIVKLASGLDPQPIDLSISELIAGQENVFQSRLIRLNNVEFVSGQRNQPYANNATKAAVQYTLQDCEKNQVVLRTSGFCYFATQTTPSGNGSIVAIASQYNNTVQLILRNATEVQMKNPVCTIITPTLPTTTNYLIKNFEDGSISSGDWLNINVNATVNWAVKTSTNPSNPGKVAECNNYIGSSNQPACETWLVSPSVDLSTATSPKFNFTSACIFSGPPPQALVSTDYTIGNPAAATWTILPAQFGTSSTYISSGNISLSAYKKKTVRLAFKYSGNNGSGQRCQIDNINISE